MTEEQLDHWFSYHPPTEETKPRLIAVEQAFRDSQKGMREALAKLVGSTSQEAMVEVHRSLATSLRHLAGVINEQAPDCADKDAAIRCLRLARTAGNEAVVITGQATSASGEEADRGFEYAERLGAIMDAECLKARWQAFAAIACGGR